MDVPLGRRSEASMLRAAPVAAKAWASFRADQLRDCTNAVRRGPLMMSLGVHMCEWNGPVARQLARTVDAENAIRLD